MDYKKIHQQTIKDLDAKRKALAAAEQRANTLREDVTRLDNLERSLRSMVEGTPAQPNVIYVYPYQQPIWQYTAPNYVPNNGTITWGNGYNCTLTNTGSLNVKSDNQFMLSDGSVQ